ncbi:MAG: ATP binding protein [Vezdaea aestivalis]|nr:MAG: ATP binding protein [Vezdaea aestivalis]
MSKFGTLVMGPAGAGKTTFCAALIRQLKASRRSCFYINMDPAAETFEFEPDLDIRDLITLEDVMDELYMGPNGGLIYCFEFLLENLDFISQPLSELTEEYLIIMDMPGQIELYTHVPVLPALAKHLSGSAGLHMSLCATYLLESSFVLDRAKFFAGTLSAMSAMVMLELPHVNIMSKMDLAKGVVGKRDLKRFLDPDETLLDEEREGEGARGETFKKLNRVVAQLIGDFSMVTFRPLDVQDEESVGGILSYIDDAIQFHEAQEPKEPNDQIDMYE